MIFAIPPLWIPSMQIVNLNRDKKCKDLKVISGLIRVSETSLLGGKVGLIYSLEIEIINKENDFCYSPLVNPLYANSEFE